MTLRASSGWCTIGGAKFSSYVSDRRTVQPTQNGEISLVREYPLWQTGRNRVDTRLSDAQRFTAATSDATGALLASLVSHQKRSRPVAGRRLAISGEGRARLSSPVRARLVVAGGSLRTVATPGFVARRESSPRPSRRSGSARRRVIAARDSKPPVGRRIGYSGSFTREATGQRAARNAVVNDRSRRPAIEDDRLLASRVRDARRGGFPASGAPRVDAQRGAQRGVRG